MDLPVVLAATLGSLLLSSIAGYGGSPVLIPALSGRTPHREVVERAPLVPTWAWTPSFHSLPAGEA